MTKKKKKPKMWNGNVEVIERTILKVSGLQISSVGEPDKDDVLDALRTHRYDNIHNTEFVGVLEVIGFEGIEDDD